MTIILLLGGSDGGFVASGTDFDKKFVLSADLADHVLGYRTTITVSIMSLRLGMWGEGMFGSEVILGGGYSNTYTTAQKNTLLIGSSLHVKEIE